MNKLLFDRNVDVCRSFKVGVSSTFSYSREDRCVVTADVIILKGLDTKPDVGKAPTHIQRFCSVFFFSLDALMRDDELSLQFPAQLPLPLFLWPSGQKGYMCNTFTDQFCHPPTLNKSSTHFLTVTPFCGYCGTCALCCTVREIQLQ